MTVNHHATVAIQDGAGRFLTVHHAKKAQHPWRWPGGKVELGELPIVAAIRELYEELGLIAEEIKFVTSMSHVSDGAFWMGHFYLVKNFQGVVTFAEPDKHDDWRYMTIEELIAAGSNMEATVALSMIGGRPAPADTSSGTTYGTLAGGGSGAGMTSCDGKGCIKCGAPTAVNRYLCSNVECVSTRYSEWCKS